MTEEEKQKILSWLKSLTERAQKIRKEADELEVIPRVRIAGYINTPLKNVGLVLRKPIIAETMSEEFKKSFMRNYKYGLTGLRNHFLLVSDAVSSCPNFWNKDVEKNTRELEAAVIFHEETKDKLFQKKK